jgi:[ribosomal protein S5]-alanine N-acetyltransferase
VRVSAPESPQDGDGGLRLPRLFTLGPPPLRLDGHLAFLRPPERGDWHEWGTLRAESRGFLAPWEPSWPADALSRAAYRRRLARYAVDWRTDQGYSFFIFSRADGRLVGGIGLSNVRRGVAETGSLGYWVGARHARRGYMAEALALLLDFGFQRLKLHRVEAACLPTNAASRGLLAKLGFREEGYARKYLCIDGKWQDHVLFGMLREEWRRG